MILQMFCLFFIVSQAMAQLSIDTVYPARGKVGQDLPVRIQGAGFNGATRLSMSLDVGHQKSVVGSVETDWAQDVTVAGDRVYMATYGGLYVIDVTNPEDPIILGKISLATSGLPYSVAVVDHMAYVAESSSILQIIDVSNPSAPQTIGAVNTSGETWDVTVAGTVAYVVDYDAGLYVIDVSDPANPSVLGSRDTPGAAVGLAVSDNMIYVADSGSGLCVIDAGNPAAPVIRATLDTGGSARDVAVNDNTAYVANGAGGLAVIDVSDPDHPDMIGQVDTDGDASGIMVVNDVAYVADASGGLVVIDVQHPETPTIIGTVDTPGSGQAVCVAGDVAYLADGSGGLQVIDVSTPEIKQIYGLYDTPGFAGGVAVEADLAVVADGAGGVQLLDIHELQHPSLLGTLPAIGNARDVSLSGGRAFVVDETGLRVLDVSNPGSPEAVGSVDTPGVAMDVAVNGQTVCVADYENGLQVIDVNDPGHPEIVGTLDTPSRAYGVAVVDHTAYVADGYDGLIVVDITDPSDPKALGNVDTDGVASGVAASGSRAYVADGDHGLCVIDISDPGHPKILGTVDTPQWAANVLVIENRAYVADEDGGLVTIDVSDPAHPLVVGVVDTPGIAGDVAVIDGMGLVADGGTGLVIVPVTVEIAPLTIKNDTSMETTLSGPVAPGHYTLRVFTDTEDDTLVAAVTFFDPSTYEVVRQKKAIIVAGGGNYPSNALWRSTRKCADLAYLSLLSQGYTKDNIYYLSAETEVDVDGNRLWDDVDGDVTPAKVAYAITTWAEDASDVILFMTDHGGDAAFQLNEALDYLNAQDLDANLDSLQQVMDGRVTVIYDACRSGSFIPFLMPPSGKSRIVIASAGSKERAWFESDGAMSFSYQLWASLFLNANLYDAYVTARHIMRNDQTALIDVNGNGIPNEKADQIAAADFIVGRGRVAASLPPTIASVSDSRTLHGETAAELQAYGVKSLIGIERVWAVITPPDYNPNDLDQPVTGLPSLDLSDGDGDGNYTGTYDGFLLTGTYGISIFAIDTEGVYSYPLRTTVVQASGESARASIAGAVKTSIAGHENIAVANAVVALEGTACETATDEYGNFMLEDVPDGNYTITITAPYFTPITRTVDITAGGDVVLDLPAMTPGAEGGYTDAQVAQMIETAVSTWDINGDGKKGIPEAIDALQITAGIRR